VILDDNIEIKHELVLVDSSELVVIVDRNLQTEMFKDIEPLKISASYNGLSIYLSKQDYTFLLTLSRENFSETVEEKSNENEVIKKAKDLTQKAETSIFNNLTPPTVTHAINLETNVLEVSQFKLKFKIQSIKGHFYTEDSPMVILNFNSQNIYNLKLLD
jgi:hypothetical protein